MGAAHMETLVDADVALDVAAKDTVSLAMVHNRVPLVSSIRISNPGRELRGATVRVVVGDDESQLSRPWEALLDIPEQGSVQLTEVDLRMDGQAMLQLEDRRHGRLQVSVTHDEQTQAQWSQDVMVLAGRQWSVLPPGLGLEMLPAHVMPNSPEIAELLGLASDKLREATGSGAIQGYQAGPERVDQIAAAIFAALQAKDIRYSNPPASWTDDGQKVRTPAEVFEGRLGTCLDTTVLMAAALEQAGIQPVLWVVEAHAFVGYWRQEIALESIVLTDPSPLVNRIDLGHMGLIETTMITDGDATFEQAGRAPREHLGRLDEVRGVVDVYVARRNGILPLPARARTATGEIQTVEYRPAEHSAPTLQLQGRASSSAEPGETGSATPVPPRVTQWKNALLDLSLRNRLINFTDRYAVTLTVPEGRLGDVEDVLHDGRQLTLRASDAIPAINEARGVRYGRDLPPEVLAETLISRLSLFTDISAQAYASRLRSLAHKARTLVEETGANNLYLALDTLVWRLEEKELRTPLILVPVQLVATGRGERTTYRLRLDEGGGSTPNYCLLEKLKQTHGLTIPKLAEPKEDLSGIDMQATLDAVRKAIAARGLPFHVEDTAHVAILQFAKFRLWKDLAEDWEELLASPLAAHLAHSPTEPFEDPSADHDVDLEGLAAACPIPADGAQLTAIADAVQGRTFVLEGPPGTGKSQTITNLLARALAEGKRVLFVAEKRAALDVVKRRLDGIGLGPFSLDLHDKGSRPAVVREQIKTALDYQAVHDEQGLRLGTDELAAWVRTLSRYAERLHERNGAGLSMYSAQTQLLGLAEDVAALPVPTSLLATSAAERVEAVRLALRTVAEVADPAHPAPVHPWGFVEIDEAGDAEVDFLAELCRRVSDGIAGLPRSGRLGAAVRAARTGEDLAVLSRLAGTDRVGLGVLDEVRTQRWQGETSSLSQEMHAMASAAHPGLDVATPDALDLPLADIHAQAQSAASSSWWGRKKRLVAVLDQLRPGLREGADVAPKAVPELAAALLHLQGAVRGLAERTNYVPGLSVPTSWNPLTEAGRRALMSQLEWLRWAGSAVRGDAGDGAQAGFVPALRAYLDAEERTDADQVTTLGEVARALEELTRRCGSDRAGVAAWSGEEGVLARWQETEGLRDSRDTDLGSLRRWVALRSHLRPLRDAGMDDAHRLLLTGDVDSDRATSALDRGLAEASLVERSRAGGLDAFRAEGHERSVQRFVRASHAVREMLPGSLHTAIVDQRGFSPRTAKGRAGSLQREVQKRRGGLAVRPLMQTYGDLITSLMPCVLVSPDSLARFFPVQAGMFDVVVFDEASQIRVADAIGAIGRGQSVVVVGDSKQMPPTSFAESALDTDPDEEELVGVVPTVEDQESILSEAVQARVQQHWLSWHYRSQDESLIAFSNEHYYKGKLSSFPAPTTGTADPGVSGHGVNLVRVDGTFHRDGTGKLKRTNPVEADAIVTDVQRRFEAHTGPGSPSIGIVTFNLQQRAYIEGLVRDHEDRRLAESLDSTEEEGLFIKNLENVQGAERDVILFSIAFGVNDKGVLPLNFGPLNREGGERRLNVAVTRARRQVVLYSSFDPGQLRSEETTSLGIQHLRAYLDLAAAGTGAIEEQRRRAGGVDRHREAVASALRKRGLVVTTDVGLSDFRIDLTVSLPEEPDRRLVAVLLDGPGWAGRRTVGDRDGLPVQVLEGILGWPGVARVWLPDWLQHRDRCVDDLEAVVRAAAVGEEREAPPEPERDVLDLSVGESAPKRSVPSHHGQADFAEDLEIDWPDGTPVVLDGFADRPGTREQAPVIAAQPSAAPADAPQALPPHTDEESLPGERRFEAWDSSRRGSRDNLDSLDQAAPSRRVREAALDCVAHEGPVHRERLARAVAAPFDLTRLTEDRIRSILRVLPSEMIRAAETDFYWSGPGEYADWRGFRGSDTYERPVEHIARRELANSMRALCLTSGGMGREELLRESLRVFGGQRMTPGIRQRMTQAATFGRREGLLTESDEIVHAVVE